MANCCFGSLTIDCDKALFEEIRSFVQSEEKVFDLNRIVPIPADREYDWVIDHWGTGKNVDDECLSDQGYCFTTAWSPCSLAVQTLAERYPQATFRYTYDECGEGFCGVEEYRDGSLAYRLMQITMSFLLMMNRRMNLSSIKTSCLIQGRRLIRQYL